MALVSRSHWSRGTSDHRDLVSLDLKSWRGRLGSKHRVQQSGLEKLKLAAPLQVSVEKLVTIVDQRLFLSSDDLYLLLQHENLLTFPLATVPRCNLESRMINLNSFVNQNLPYFFLAFLFHGTNSTVPHSVFCRWECLRSRPCHSWWCTRWCRGFWGPWQPSHPCSSSLSWPHLWELEEVTPQTQCCRSSWFCMEPVVWLS